jgi:Ca2+-binding RTX toxin-like protein
MTVDITRPTSHDSLSLAEFELYHRIMDYRAGLGLAPVPLSKALTATAGRHVADTRENIWADDLDLPAGANLHSWSNAFYYADHRAPEAMWDAPERIGTGYTAPGYEITAAGMTTPRQAFEIWRGSPAHEALMANRGAWADQEWRAIGIGFDVRPGDGPYAGRIAHVWLGAARDDRGPPAVRGTSGADEVEATRFSDIVHGRGSGDDILGLGGNDRLSGGNGNDRLGGGSGDDRLLGGKGNDRLFGYKGDDRLQGGGGADLLVGGTGRDVLSGGAGPDVYRFSWLSEAGFGSRRDVITNFDRGSDTLDLTAMNADSTREGNEAFRFLGGANYTGRAGQLRVQGGTVAGDVDGDERSDFQIEIGVTLSAADILL